MAQALLQENFMLPHFAQGTINFIESIKKYISENECPHLKMDISNLNIIDASRVTILCSTYHWAKYPHGEISLKTNSSALDEIIKPLNLGNIKLVS